MVTTIRRLLASRKFVLLLVGVIVSIGARVGLELDRDLVISILGLFAIAIGGVAYEDGQRAGAGSSPAIGTVIGAVEGGLDRTPPAGTRPPDARTSAIAEGRLAEPRGPREGGL